MAYRLPMSFFTVGPAEVLRRTIYPPFVSLWNALRNLTGRQARRQKAADAKAATAAKYRQKTIWKNAQDR
jgi:hypothetical protein